MLFLCLAFSIDYSFFMLTRFQEERFKFGRSISDAVRVMIRTSGSIVMVSGMLLVITWLALGFFPVNGLDSVGYCSAVAVGACLLSNLIIAPSMLLSFPVFFSNTGGSPCSCCPCYSSSKEKKEISTDSNLGEPLFHTPTPQGVRWRGYSAMSNSTGEVKRNFYARIGKYISVWPRNLIVPVVILGLLGWGATLLSQAKFSLGASFSLGKSPVALAFAKIQQTAPFDRSGIFQTPFSILQLRDEGRNTIFEESYFDSNCKLAECMAKSVRGLVVPSLQGVGVSAFNGEVRCLNYSKAMTYIDAMGTGKDSAIAAEYRYTLQSLTTVKANATKAEILAANASVLTFAPMFNPFSTKSKLFVEEIRRCTSASEHFQLFHPIVTEVDSEVFTISRFPTVFAVTLGLCFFLISLRFKAAIIPFKLVITVVVPILFVFGACVGVYQYGALNFLNAAPFMADTGVNAGISWLLPVSTVFLLSGLALDYDIFLYSRVFEFRKQGNSNLLSIVKAVEITGPTISSAGVIMALAFLGMVAGSNKFLNQFGFVMILGVLLDTFIVRILLVPSLLSLGGFLNYWPMKMPTPKVEGDEYQVWAQ